MGNVTSRTAETGSPSRDDLIANFEARFRRPLMSYFLRRVANHADAEDLTQQVFLRLLGSSHSSDATISNSDGLVFTIATNLLRDRSRRARRAILPAAGEPAWTLVSEITAEVTEERSPERVVAARETLDNTIAALRSLGEKTHDIFILHRLENMKIREIADLYGLTVSAIEKHLIKATLFLARQNSDCRP